MLSYQHAFHAGNHADLLKHYVLTFVINSLNKKEKPYTFFDTHSGSGLYDMTDTRVLKTGEAQKGIFKLLEDESKIPSQLQCYVDLVKQYTAQNMYPGSPEIERRLLRKQDTLILSELHPQEIQNLRHNMTDTSCPHKMNTPMTDTSCPHKNSTLMTDTSCPNTNKNSTPMSVMHVTPQIHNRNGWEMLKALTPPKTKRGAVLIDPSYEETADYLDATKTIIEVHKKWNNGIIMLWYPLLLHRETEIETMLKKITDSARQSNENIEIANLQLSVYDKNDTELPRLYGSGMLVLNAPWKLEEEANVVINYLKNEIGCQFQKDK